MLSMMSMLGPVGLSMLLFAAATHPPPQAGAPLARGAGAPARTSGPTHLDVRSETGRTYRLFVRVPSQPPPSGGYPVLYVLDGNWHFNTAADAVAMQSSVGEVPAAIVVGIGYPDSDQASVLRRRWEDFSQPADPASLPPPIRALEPRLGGADDFLAFLNSRVKPLVSSLAPINIRCQTLYGHSLGGVFALHVLFRSPESFDAYVAASPAIWWDLPRIRRSRAAFAERAGRAELGARLMLTVGRLEQRSDIADPALARRVASTRMVDNVTDLRDALARLPSSDLKVTTILYEDETHNSVIPGTISRALRFGLRCPAPAGRVTAAD